MSTIRVLIADDSALARAMLRDFLESEEGIEVVGEAENGEQAVQMTRQLKPNLVTMDLEMPVMNGMAAIEEIMCSAAVPILVVSSVTDAHNALEAVGHGALDAVSKPDYSPEMAAEFVAKVRLLASVTVITHLRPRKLFEHAALAPLPQPAFPSHSFSHSLPSSSSHAHAHLSSPLSLSGEPQTCGRVFAIASSTGGPQALARILSSLPATFPCPVLIAQHISDGFAGGMVDWLATLCKLPVRLAGEGDALQPGVIHVSPSEQHLGVLPNRRLTLQARGALDVYRPSCDVLLDSVAGVFGDSAVGIILTGMGSDGARGMGKIRQQGGITLAQDEASSVIFGMNQVAIAAGAIQKILPLEAIAGEMIRLAEQRAVRAGV